MLITATIIYANTYDSGAGHDSMSASAERAPIHGRVCVVPGCVPPAQDCTRAHSVAVGPLPARSCAQSHHEHRTAAARHTLHPLPATERADAHATAHAAMHFLCLLPLRRFVPVRLRCQVPMPATWACAAKLFISKIADNCLILPHFQYFLFSILTECRTLILTLTFDALAQQGSAFSAIKKQNCCELINFAQFIDFFLFKLD